MTDEIYTPEYGDVEDQEADILQLRNILKDEIQFYTALNPVKGYMHIALQWLLIFGLGTFAIQIGTWWSYLIVLPFIAGRQHALGAIGHDGAHYRLSRNKRLNDWITDYFLMLPTFFSVNRWRSEHIAHHRLINSEGDPYLADFKLYKQWDWPKTRASAFRTYFGDIFGLALNTAIEPSKRWGPFSKVKPALSKDEKFRIYTFYPSVLIIITFTDSWLILLLLWFLPMFTFVIFFVRWRTVAEHLGMGDVRGIAGTRNVDRGILQELFFGPSGINYHLDHHIFPTVPFYNLYKFHGRLLKEPIYRDNAINKAGYFGKDSVYNDVVIG